jgi:hypothetical protein
MTVAIIGSGKMGSGLARLLASKGFEVTIGVYISTTEDAATLGENSFATITGVCGALAAGKFALVMGSPEFALASNVSVAKTGEVFGDGVGGGAFFTFAKTYCHKAATRSLTSRVRSDP